MPGWEGVVGLGLGLLFLGVLVGVRLVRWGGRRKGRHVANRGLRGEAEGIRLLEAEGFELVDTQVRRRTTLEVDGESLSFELRLDAVVTRDGHRYVAEFKTGNVATVGAASTRRQLLEYAVAFPDHGMLLVDVEAEEVLEIEFPGLRALAERAG